MDAGGVLRHVGLVPENPEVRHQEPESHQCDAGANPGEKRSLFGEIIPQVSRWLFFDRGIHSARLHIGAGNARPVKQVCRHTGDDLVVIAVFGSVLRPHERIQLHALAYDRANVLRTRATPEPIKDWSLTSPKMKLVKMGAKLASDQRY